MLIAAISAAIALLIVLLLTRRSLYLHRSVLLHAPAPLVWRCIEDFPQLLAGHGRGRTQGAFGQYAFVKGNSHSRGSVWRTRGSWAGSEYWVDAELIRVEAGREIAIRLLRDSLRTHHGLRGHIARLTLQPNGPGTSKLTWDLQARFRPMRLLWHRHCDRDGLHARLLDICLRSVKVAIDNGNSDPNADAGDTRQSADGSQGESPLIVVPSPPAAGPGGPPLHLH